MDDVLNLDDIDEVYTKRLMSEPVTCIDIFGVPAMLIEYKDMAYKAWLEEHGWYRYELVGGRDNDPGLPCAIERHAVVNWCGTVFTKMQLLDDAEGEEYRDIGEDDFSYAEDPEITYEEFMDILVKYC